MGCPPWLLVQKEEINRYPVGKKLPYEISTALTREKLMRAAPQGTGVKRREI